LRTGHVLAQPTDGRGHGNLPELRRLGRPLRDARRLGAAGIQSAPGKSNPGGMTPTTSIGRTGDSTSSAHEDCADDSLRTRPEALSPQLIADHRRAWLVPGVVSTVSGRLAGGF
jgi:hypothetical protein